MFNRLIYFILLLLVMRPITIFAAINAKIPPPLTNNTAISLKKVKQQSATKLKWLNKQNFKMVGEAKFSILFWDIYQSKLLTTSGKYPIEAKNDELLYEIRYLKDISRDELIKRTKEQWQHLGIANEQYKHFIPELKRLWPNITQGDTLSLLIQNQHSNFYFNQQYIGSINAPQFGQLFIDIWLAKNTSQPKLRRQLLGNTTHD